MFSERPPGGVVYTCRHTCSCKLHKSSSLYEGYFFASNLLLGGVNVHDCGGCVRIKSGREVSFLCGPEQGRDGVKGRRKDGSYGEERKKKSQINKNYNFSFD